MLKRLVLGVMLLGSLGVEAWDAGGVSVDLGAMLGPRGQAGGGALSEGEDRIADGDFESALIDLADRRSSWFGTHWIHGCRSDELRRRIAGLSRRSIEKKAGRNGSDALWIHSPEAISALQKDEEPNPQSTVQQDIDVPDSETPTKWMGHLHVRGRFHPVAGFNSFRVYVDFMRKSDKADGSYALIGNECKEFALSAAWQEHAFPFVAPPHCRRFQLRLSLYGCGDAWIDDVSLRPRSGRRGASIQVNPGGFIDGLFCLGQGVPGAVVFLLRNEDRIEYHALRISLDVPPGFEFLAVNDPGKVVRRTARPDGSSRVELDVQAFAYGMPHSGYHMWNRPAAILKSSLPPGERTYPLTFRLSDGDWQGPLGSVDLKVIPAAEGRTPARFSTGIRSYHEFMIGNPAAREMAGLLARSGFNAFSGGFSPEFRQELARARVDLRVSSFHIANGCRIGPDANRTPESYFRDIDGRPLRFSCFKTCPVEVYGRGPFYRSQVLPILEEAAVKDQAIGLFANWEPYYLDFKGCFCDRCREEFCRFLEAKGQGDPAGIRRLWPRRILDSRYRRDWISFRSMQNGRVCQTLEEDAAALGRRLGREFHFIPSVGWNLVSHHTRGGQGKQYASSDYLDKMKWLIPWGPYVYTQYTEDFVYHPGIYLAPYFAAADMKAYVREQIPDPGRRPKLIAYPHSLELCSWVTTPEAIAFETVSFFVNGFEASCAFGFPAGYDQRYWNAMARANRLIADHEDWLFDGRDATSRTEVRPATPLPAPFYPVCYAPGSGFARDIPGFAEAGMIQARAFELDGGRLVAIGNFWERGECFFRLKLRGLEPEKAYQVDSSEGFSLGSFSGAELSGGILGHVGGLRWVFYTVSGKRGSSLPEIGQAELQERLRRRLPDIQAALEREREYSAEYHGRLSSANPVNDYSKVREIRNRGVAFRAVEVDGRDYLQIRCERYTALLDAAAGASIPSWVVDGQELVTREAGTGLGMSAFFYPDEISGNLDRGFQLVGGQPSPEGIQVELSRTCGGLDPQPLDGIKIDKTLRFSPDGITVTTRISNGTPKEFPFAFRYHGIPRHLNGAEEGAAGIGSRRLERCSRNLMVLFGPADRELQENDRDRRTLSMPLNTVSLSARNLPTVRLTFPSPPPYGLFCWDAEVMTLEPVFPRLRLPPGKQASYDLRLQLDPLPR